MTNNAAFDYSKMTLVFADKEFHPTLSLETSQQTNNQEAYKFAKYMDNNLEQLCAYLRMSQKAQKMLSTFIELKGASLC